MIKVDGPNGSATIQQGFTPKYKDTTFPNFKLFMPYDELNLARGWHNLVAVLEIQNERAKDLTTKKVNCSPGSWLWATSR